MSGRYFWLKLGTQFFKKDEIKVIQSQENGSEYLLFWIKLLCKAVEQAEPGQLRFLDTIPYNEALLSTVLETDIDVVRSAMKLFENLGMLQVVEDGTIWIEQAEKMVGSESSSAQRVRAFRERKKALLLQCNESNAQSSIELRVQSLEKDKDSASAPPPGQSTTGYSSEFETWWDAYPRHKEKQKAFKRWKTTIKGGATTDQLLAATKAYAAECRRKGTVEDYIKHPATFLSASQPWRDYLGSGEARENVDPLVKTCRACGKSSETTSPDCPKCGEPDAYRREADHAAI